MTAKNDLKAIRGNNADIRSGDKLMRSEHQRGDDFDENENSNRRSKSDRKMNFHLVCVASILFVCCLALAGVEIWNSIRVTKLQTEIQELNQKFIGLQKQVIGIDNRINNSRHGNRLLSPADVLTGERGRSNGNNSDYYDDDLYYDESDEEDDDDDYESEKSSNVTKSAGANLAMPPMTDKKNLFDDKKDSFDGDYPEESDKMTPFIDDDIPATGKQSDTVKRTSRSVITSENDERQTDAAKLKFINELPAQVVAERANKFPKKFTADNETTSHIRHKHHRHSKKAHIDRHAPHRFVQEMNEDEVMPAHQANRAKPRRRVLRPMPTNSVMQYNRAVRSPSQANNLRYRTIAMHYHGDTTNYLPGGRLAHHGRFDGNGRVRHTGGVYSDWKTSDWADDHSMNHYFSIIDGVVTVKEQGLYYIYAQIFYDDDHDVNGFMVEHNAQPLYQCTRATHTTHRTTKSNSCHTSGINYLNAGDTIHIRDLASHRYALLDPSKSFFGLIKMGDIRGMSNSRSVSAPNAP